MAATAAANALESDFILFAFLPCDEHGFPGVVLEHDRARFLGFEVGGGDLFAVEKSEGGAVGEESPEFFHQIQGQRRTTWAVAVEKTALGMREEPIANSQ